MKQDVGHHIIVISETHRGLEAQMSFLIQRSPCWSFARGALRSNVTDGHWKAVPVPNTRSTLLCSIVMSATSSPPFPRAPPGAPTEQQANAFDDDPRVHFDTQSARWRLEDGDAEYEYEPSKAVWIPVVSLPLPPRDN